MKRLLFLLIGWAVVSAPAHASVQIMPHKALYKISIGKVKNGSDLQDVTGSMQFDWADACDGWTQEQHIDFGFFFSDGTQSDIKSSMMTWESKDGRDFTFYVRRTTDGVEDEAFKGRAHMAPQKTSATFTLPKESGELTFPKGTMFPVGHMLQILEKAQSGERFFTRRIFDGAQNEGADQVSAFIGAPRGAAKKEEVEGKLFKHALLKASAWPVRLAFYEAGSKQSTPDYEMDMLLQENGIARFIEIDYGAFSIVGQLSKIEKNKQLACSEGQKNP